VTAKDEALAALAEADTAVRNLADQLAEARDKRVAAVAAALAEGATWEQVGQATRQSRQNAFNRYATKIDVTVTRQVRVKNTDSTEEAS